MERERFLEQVRQLRAEGKSIRNIGHALGVHRSSVERALKALVRQNSVSAGPISPPNYCPSCHWGNPRGARFCNQCGVPLARSADNTKPSTEFTDGFVGRQREMGILTSALQSARSGRGRLILLAGEPGIGKTRVARELAYQAELLGTLVIWGWCHEDPGAPVYWPWIQSIRSYCSQKTPRQLRSEMGPGAADIAEIVAGLASKLGELETPPALDPQQARFRFYDSITTFLQNGARSQPLMVILDDLQWADEPSLMLLQFLARQIASSQLLLLGTYRDTELSRQHPLLETLAQLSHEPVFQREFLRGLPREDVGRFIEITSGICPAEKLAEAVYVHTEGNPFFIAEVIRLLSERGELEEARDGVLNDIRIPEGVREVIGQRLVRLSVQCNLTLITASILGREFDFNLLSLLSEGLSEEQLLEAVDEALEAHLIEEVAGQHEHYQFSHSLVQQTLAEELSTSRRVRLHARVAEVLEGRYGDNREFHAAELAFHFAEAESVLGPEKLIRYSRMAGESSLAAYAWEDALAHFQRGLDAKEGQPVDEETALLCFGLGRAQMATRPQHQIGEAISSLSRAFEYYAQAQCWEQVVAILATPAFSTNARYLIQKARLLPRALALVPTGSSAEAWLLSRYGLELGRMQNDLAGAQDAFHRALESARRKGDPELETWTLVYSSQVNWWNLRWRESLELSLRAIELAESTADPRVQAYARRWAYFPSITSGDLEAARNHAAAELVLAQTLRERRSMASALWDNCDIARLEGDWNTARDFNHRGIIADSRDPRILTSRLSIECEVGDYLAAQVYLEQLLSGLQQPSRGSGGYPGSAVSAVIALAARISDAPDRLGVAEEIARTSLDDSSTLPGSAEYARVGLALISVMREDKEAANEQYNILLSQKGTMCTVGIAIDRLLGLLTQSMGQTQQAIVHFEDALVFCRQAGYRPELAWSLCDYADCLFSRKQSGDLPRARSLLDESLVIASELGMIPLIQRILARQDRATAQSTRAPNFSDGLSQREMEVLQLLVQGKTNREIAQELTISLRTVANHVASILAKTNTANRTEVASYATRHDLV